MLVLSRKKNEAITVGLGDGRMIQVYVVEIRGDKVRLGIIAPADVSAEVPYVIVLLTAGSSEVSRLVRV